MRSVNNEKQLNVVENQLTAEKKDSAGTSAQGMGEGNRIISGEIVGNVEMIDEKSLTVKDDKKTITINVNSTNSVMIANSGEKNQVVVGKLADLKKGDMVKVIYDESTKNALKIAIIRISDQSIKIK